MEGIAINRITVFYNNPDIEPDTFESAELPGLGGGLLTITLSASRQININLGAVRKWEVQIGAIQIADKIPAFKPGVQ